jgi:fatty acid desaturase
VHRNVSANPWINDVAGILGVLPYMAPFYLEKWFHLQHHALLNQREDPNFIYTDGPLWQLPFRYLRVLRYAHDRMADDPRTRWQKKADWIPRVVIGAICAVAIWRGVFFDIVLLWFVPLVISKLIMDWYVNFLPHVGLPPHRFLGTRIVDVQWLTFAILCHNYHAIHHLWPSIPWHRYRATFTQKLDYLREHGVPIETRITWSRTDPAKIADPDPLAG